jgi:NAD+ synthase (glutamine-hydrolysing)
LQARGPIVAKDIQLNKDLGMLRIGAAVPQLRVADIDFNVTAIIEGIKEAGHRNVQLLCFPEMAITGYTLGDLVQQEALLNKTKQGLEKILAESKSTPMLVMVGMPLIVDQKLFSCAAIINFGRILGIIPKTLLPSHKEFYEGRWFSSSREAISDTIELAGQQVPFGADILFTLNGLASATVGVEICEDLWNPLSPHEFQAVEGATILVNLSASNDILGKADWRRTMVSSESGRCIAAYCYVSSGPGESSNDMILGGHCIIAENGNILNDVSHLSSNLPLIVSDIDLERLANDRRAATSFRAMCGLSNDYRKIETNVVDFHTEGLERVLDPHPFVPKDPARRAERCREIFSMQVAALAQKIIHSSTHRIIIGISGGLDSTLSLLVAIKTMDLLRIPRTNVHAFNLPGFGTTVRTKNNAAKLCRALEVNFEKQSIVRSCKSHLKDLKHDGEDDIVFENVQARYRTEYLFNKANQLHGVMLGTGDLTEIALGWCTFAGDQISHYHVNASVPKTLVRYMIRWVGDEELAHSAAQKVLYDILDTPISPELKRPKNGEISQMSEDVIGPVELADFYLYPFIRFGMRPGKILYLANEVRKQNLFDENYTLDELKKWMRSFLERFFTNQFKRTCMPEGPKVGSVSLSPRADWRMPSDASANLWIEDLEAMYKRLSQN